MGPSPGCLKRQKSPDKERAQFSVSLLTPYILKTSTERSLYVLRAHLLVLIFVRSSALQRRKRKGSHQETRDLRPWATPAISQRGALHRSGQALASVPPLGSKKSELSGLYRLLSSNI